MATTIVTAESDARALLSQERYDLLKADYAPPDETDSKYIRHTAQNLELEEFNGHQRTVKRVTISGVHLTFDKQDRNRLVGTYSGQEDIKELYLLGDTIVIATPLIFPQTKVYIFARELRFEFRGEEQPYIDTRPRDTEYRDPLVKDGRDGAQAGNIHLYIAKFTPSVGVATKHFRAAGGQGQNPDAGEVLVSKTLKNLKPITKDQWDNVFNYEHRKVKHEVIAFGQGYESTVPYPSWDTFNGRYSGGIVYVELNNRYYQDSFHINTSGVEVVASAGSKEEPGTGGAAQPPGRPGTGGSGGHLRSTVQIPATCIDLHGGRSGGKHPGTRGGPGGTPSTAYWLTFSGWPDGAEHRFTAAPNVTAHPALQGPASGPGPEPKAPKGQDGTLSLISGAGYVWVVPTLLNIVLQYAKDRVVTGHVDLAVMILKPYSEALAAAEAGKFDLNSALYTPEGLSADVLGGALALTQLRQEMKAITDQATARVDHYGNPPGWVPGLSLESAVDIYRRVLESSIRQLYNAYVLEKIWNEKADKTEALNNLIDILTEKTKNAQESMVEGRKKIAPLMDDLKQLVSQMGDLATALSKREEELKSEADYKALAEEQKQAVAAGFKISGALLKALPLPEPAQAIAGAAGSVLDVTSNFIEGGASDEAFTALKKEVTDFAGKDETLAAFSQDMQNDLNANNSKTLEMNVAAASLKQKQSDIDQVYGAEVTALEGKKKEEELYLNLKKQEQDLINKKTESTSPQLITIQGQLAAHKSELDNKNAALKTATDNVAVKKSALEAQKAVLEQKKKDREQDIKTRVQQVKNIASSIETIGKTVNKLLVSQAQLNGLHDKILAGIKAKDDKFVSLVNQIAYLGEKKRDVTAALLKANTELAENGRVISKNLVLSNELRAQLAKANRVLDPSALVYIQSISQDAHQDLQRFLYYVVKAYEYYMVQPWKQSYLDAQKIFEDLRRVLEPSEFKFDFADEAGKDKQKQLQDLLQRPSAGGKLESKDFELLKMVYEKPLQDMGKELAGQLMTGSAKLMDAPKPVTLNSEDLKELNDRIANETQANAIPFSLLQLRQVESSRERQRIRNIKIQMATCQKLGKQFPDQVIFKFTHLGKSVVRAGGRLYAFEPEGAKSPTGATFARVSFETDGGRSGSGWAVDLGDPEKAVLQKKSLWQPSVTAQANLLTKLLNSKELITLSEFRPGIFSDFLFTVEFQPSESKVKFTELVLSVEMEIGNAPVGEVLVSIRNNLGLAIPVRASQNDKSGRSGGMGTYTGIYDNQRLSESPVRLTVPEKFGEFLHTGWLLDGQTTKATTHYQDVRKSAYIVANYEKQAS